ncbi:MAG: DUF998 domain-containing protein [Candidatus Bathyarchaeia archaeon]
MRTKIFKIFGLLAPTIGYTSIALAIMLSPSFSWTKNALSDLGVMENSALIFNFGLMISAICMFFFGIGLFNIFKGFVGIIGIAFYLLSAIALFAIGLFPETTGIIHFYVSVAFFCFLPLALIPLGYALLKASRKTFGLITLAFVFLTIFIWIIPWSSAAIPEFLSSMLNAIWTAYMAIYFLK